MVLRCTTFAYFRCIAAASGLLLVQCASAADWVRVATSSEGSFYVDTSSTSRDGRHTLATVKAVFKDMQIGPSGVGYLISISQRRVVCASKEMASVEVKYFDGKDRLVDTQRNATLAWNTPKDGTIAEAIVKGVCGVEPSASAPSAPQPKEKFTAFSKDDDEEWSLVNESLAFNGKRFDAVVLRELTKPLTDDKTSKEVKFFFTRVEGDCGRSMLGIVEQKAFDDQGEFVRTLHVSDSEKQPKQYASGTVAYLLLTTVCSSKGYQVTASKAGSASAKSKEPAPSQQRAARSSGSAFAVTATGHLLTNNHVVKDCETLAVSAPGVAPARGRVIARDDRNDLALVQAPLATPTYAAFRTSPMRPGESIVALGFPLKGVLANEVNVSTGTVSALAGIANDTSKLQISAPIQPGNSGGPLLDSTASISGIVVEKLDALAMARSSGTIPEGIAFGIKSELAVLFLRSAGVEPRMAPLTLPRLDGVEVAQRGRPMTYLLECEVRS